MRLADKSASEYHVDGEFVRGYGFRQSHTALMLGLNSSHPGYGGRC